MARARRLFGVGPLGGVVLAVLVGCGSSRSGSDAEGDVTEVVNPAAGGDAAVTQSAAPSDTSTVGSSETPTEVSDGSSANTGTTIDSRAPSESSSSATINDDSSAVAATSEPGSSAATDGDTSDLTATAESGSSATTNDGTDAVTGTSEEESGGDSSTSETNQDTTSEPAPSTTSSGDTDGDSTASTAPDDTTSCADVDCDAPPPPVCIDDTLVSFAAVGVCETGECAYAPLETECAFGCAAARCNLDPCADVACDEPPEPICDGTSLRTYAAVGTCDQGTCTYESTQQSCYACNEGACFCPAGTAVSGSSCVPCVGESYSSTSNAVSCMPFTVCDPGYWVLEEGTATSDRACAECSEGTYSTTSNAADCDPHTTCSGAEVESSPPTSTTDRVCSCGQVCGDGRCLGAEQCCESTPYGTQFELYTLGTSVTFDFCLDFATEVFLSGGSGGPPGNTPTVSVVVRSADDAVLGSFTGGDDVYVPVEPGSYSVTLTISDGEGGGGVVAQVGPPPPAGETP